MTFFCRFSGDEKDLCIWGGVYGGELNWIGVLENKQNTVKYFCIVKRHVQGYITSGSHIV